MQTAVELGPWGGTGGTPWNYDEENIRSFQVASGGEVIVSITFNGTRRFGGVGGNISQVSPSSIGKGFAVRCVAANSM